MPKNGLEDTAAVPWEPASQAALKPPETLRTGAGPTLCRDCLSYFPAGPLDCPACGSIRVICHAELAGLDIAHIDCDPFYAAVEQRDFTFFFYTSDAAYDAYLVYVCFCAFIPIFKDHCLYLMLSASKTRPRHAVEFLL